jgi:hypothetical protein
MMKKLVVIFAVLALAAPLYAQNVTITLTDEGSNVFRVDYNNSGAVDDVSGYGFSIALSEGTISAISDYKTGESGNDYGGGTALKGYGIFPGSVDIDTTGDDPVVNSWGTPVDMTNAPGTGIGTDTIYVAMGALYETGNQPDATGTLFKFTIDCTGATSEVTITVTGDSERAGDAGGIVLVDGSNTGITVTGDLTACDDNRCPYNGTETQKALWVTLGEPANWCGDCWLCGDVNGSCEVTFGDVLDVFTYRSTSDPNGDINMSGEVTFGDVLDVFTHRSAGGCAQAGCTPCTPLP